LISWLDSCRCVLYLAEDPGVVVADRIIFDGFEGEVLPQAVHHLYLLERDHHSAAGAALPLERVIPEYRSLDRSVA